MLLANLPPYTPSGSVSTVPTSNTLGANALSFIFNSGGAQGGQMGTMTLSSTFTGSPQGGTSTPFSLSQPTVISDCIVAVLP